MTTIWKEFLAQCLNLAENYAKRTMVGKTELISFSYICQTPSYAEIAARRGEAVSDESGARRRRSARS